MRPVECALKVIVREKGVAGEKLKDGCDVVSNERRSVWKWHAYFEVRRPATSDSVDH